MVKSILVRALFALDFWIASTLITTMVGNMFFQNDRVILISFSLICAVVNAIFWSFIVTKMNSNFFSRNKNSKKVIKN